MKKIIISICTIVFFFLLFNNQTEQIRIRVIANSNNEIDQCYKQEVVKYLYLNYKFEFMNYKECDEYLTSNINSIKNDMTSKFTNIEVSYEYHNFNNKSYNDKVEKENIYKTLLINIGSAEGENFWGVLYSDKYIENEDTIKYKSYLVDLFKKGDLNV